MATFYIKQFIGHDIYVLASARPLIFPGDQAITVNLHQIGVQEFSPLAFLGSNNVLHQPASLEFNIHGQGVALTILLNSECDVFYTRNENCLICKLTMIGPA